MPEAPTRLMPFDVTIDDGLRRVTITLRGALTTAEMMRVLDDARSAMGDSVGYDVLSDHRLVTVPATPEQVQASLTFVKAAGGGLRKAYWAIVSASPASFGMMRVLQAHAQLAGIRVEVFRDLESAENWLAESRPE